MLKLGPTARRMFTEKVAKARSIEDAIEDAMVIEAEAGAALA